MRSPSIIRGRAAASGFTICELADRSGINRQTLYRRLRDPNGFTLMELRAIDRQIHLTDEEVVRLVRRGQ